MGERLSAELEAEIRRDFAAGIYPHPGEIRQLLSELDAVRGELAEARARVLELKRALVLAELDVSMERSWCRLCRTEWRGAYRGRDAHPHERRCPLREEP